MMVLCTQVNKMYVIATLSVYPHRASLKNNAWPRWDSNLGPLECQPNALPTELRGQAGSSKGRMNPTVARHYFSSLPGVDIHSE